MPPAQLTVEQLLQLYAPLAGLLGVVFWLGVISQRVRVGERRQDKTEERLDTIDEDKVEHGRVLERLDNLGKTMEKMERDMSGMQRSMANIATGRGNQVFGQGDG